MKYLTSLRIAISRLAILAGLLTVAVIAALGVDAGESVLYRFRGGSDGAFPTSGLVADRFGNLYGTTEFGGAGLCYLYGCGTVFQLTPPTGPGGTWKERVLYSFQAGTDGGGPQGGLIFDKSGNLYGTTIGGGQNAGCPNCGTVFQLVPPSTAGGNWTEVVLYRFTGNSDGAMPVGSLIFDKAGNLYGVTSSGGGPAENGTVFQLAPPGPGGIWTEHVLYRFKPENGSNPQYGLIMDDTGNLYGTTQHGGDAECEPQFGLGCGIVFELVPPLIAGDTWSEKILHVFHGQPQGDGAFPLGGVIFDGLGNLYGTTAIGGIDNGGTVFQLTPPFSTDTILYAFTGLSDGAGPEGSLVFHNGNLYGATVSGGGNSGNGWGTLFQLAPPRTGGSRWTETVLHVFFAGGRDGRVPNGANLLLLTGNSLYGTTDFGGSTVYCPDIPYVAGCGTVFRFVLCPGCASR